MHLKTVTGVLAASALCLAGCHKDSAAPAVTTDAKLLSQAKMNLTEREKKLTSYRLAGSVEEAGQKAGFEFAFRSPNRMKGTVSGEASRTFSFDGDRLFVLSPGEKTLTTVEMKLKPEQAGLQLMQMFQPMMPEGYRAPLLPMDRANAKKVTRPNVPDAVELSSTVSDDSGGTIEVAYVYRWPAMDLLEKRLTAGGRTMMLRVDEEQCDERLKVCVPKKLVQTIGGQPGATTTLSSIELNAAVPQDTFTLALPEGYTAQSQELVAK